MTKLSKGNSKIGNIMNISLTPIKSCIGLENVCAKDCYAMKAYKQYPNTRKAWDANYIMATDFPELFFLHIHNELCKYKGKYFRWHVAGDFLSREYYARCCKLALEFPQIRFLAFTKQYDIVNYFADKKMIPSENFNVVFSSWPAYKMDNPHNFPVAWMNDKAGVEDRIPADSFVCPGSCDECYACWGFGKGQSVVFTQH